MMLPISGVESAAPAGASGREANVASQKWQMPHREWNHFIIRAEISIDGTRLPSLASQRDTRVNSPGSINLSVEVIGSVGFECVFSEIIIVVIIISRPKIHYLHYAVTTTTTTASEIAAWLDTD